MRIFSTLATLLALASPALAGGHGHAGFGVGVHHGGFGGFGYGSRVNVGVGFGLGGGYGAGFSTFGAPIGYGNLLPNGIMPFPTYGLPVGGFGAGLGGPCGVGAFGAAGGCSAPVASFGVQTYSAPVVQSFALPQVSYGVSVGVAPAVVVHHRPGLVNRIRAARRGFRRGF